MFEFDKYTYFSLSLYPLLLHFQSHVEDTKFNSANLIFIKMIRTDKYRLTETKNVSSANLVMGQVKILKRDEKWSPPPKNKEISASTMKSPEFFAGTTFDESPLPSALPLPSLAWLQNPRHNLLLRFEAAAAEA